MKKVIFVSILTLMTGFLFAKPFAKGTTLYVSAQNIKLRKAESPLSAAVTTIYYGDSCIVLESNEKNTKIQMCTPDQEEGWISNGSLTKKKVTASTRQASRASADELAMAGKGFSAAAEEAFKKKNKDLDYAKVDEIEKITVSDSEVANFIKEGHLNGGEE